MSQNNKINKMYRIVYKTIYQRSQEKEIDIDFETEEEAKEVLEKLKSTSTYKKISYSFIRKY